MVEIKLGGLELNQPFNECLALGIHQVHRLDFFAAFSFGALTASCLGIGVWILRLSAIRLFRFSIGLQFFTPLLLSGSAFMAVL